MYKLRCLVFAILAGIFTACSSDYVIEESPQLVVEGWIENGDFPHVIVTTTIPISEEHKSLENISEYMIKWAKVTVSDGEKEVVLTGFPDNSIMPPYIYRTSEMKGEVGKTYTLMVEYKDFVATATTTIPEVVPIKSIKQNKIKGTDDLYTCTISFDDPEQKGNYYKIFSSNDINGRQFLSTYLGTLSDEVLTKNVDIEVYPGHKLTELENYNLYFTKGEKVCIKLCSIDKESYDFWRDYGDMLSFGRNFLLPYTNTIRSNMKGAYGYWCGYGSDSKILAIGENDTSE